MSRIKLLIVIAILVVATGCKRKNRAKEMPPIGVESAVAVVDSIYNRINIASQIKSLNSAVIQPRVSGFLTSINFQGGDRVKRGQLLFSIDPSTFATTLYSARAALASAQAQEALAERNYERAAPLARIDAISQSDLDQYRANYKAAKASTKSAEEALRSAELQIGYTKIYAPISGVVQKCAASVGDYIGLATLNSELTTISQLDTICVELPIPTSKYLSLSSASSEGSLNNENLLSDITLILSDSSVYPLKGSYYYTLKDTPAASSTVAIMVRFPNPNLELKTGMFARVGANIGERRACVVVPKAAVSQLQGVNSIWVIKPDSTAQWRSVVLGQSHEGLFEIKEGLAAGERVATSGTMKLHNGVKVATSVAKK